MASAEVVQCPSCRHPVRVPESLLGQPVRCPECKAYFAAPTRDAEGHLGEPELLAETPAVEPAGRRPSSPLLVPALFLMLVGVIGVGVFGVQAVRATQNPEEFRTRVVEMTKEYARITKKEIPEDQAKEVADQLRPVLWVAFGAGVLTVLGAVAMLTMRLRWIAILGSFAAILNIAGGCCLIGLPVGVWCLVKLFDPQIRPLFSRAG